MGRFVTRIILLVTGIQLTVTAFADGEADVLKDWIIERTEYSAVLQDHTVVAVTNHFGDIRVRTSNDDMISIFAITQRHIKDVIKSQIQIDSVENTLQIAVKYPSQADNKDANHINDIDITNRRVDISLLIPKYATLSMNTIDGRIESKGHLGPIQAKTDSGQVILVTRGPVNVSSDDGPITITFKNDKWSAPSSVESSTGKIHVLFIENPDINVEMQTAGTITTDYSVEISNNIPASAQKQATARIGKATHQLKIKSSLGPVILSRIFNMMKSN